MSQKPDANRWNIVIYVCFFSSILAESVLQFDQRLK